MAIAELADVEARLGRELSTDETAQATVLLDDAEIVIKARIPDIDQKITDEDLDVAIVKMVEANAVVRVLRNPDGFTSETDGDYTYQRNGRLATGQLEILENEWALLGAQDAVFTVALRPRSLRELCAMYRVPFSCGG